jgi:hypothetical protein
MSQDELAKAVRAAGDQAGEPNDCSKRLVQRWEAGKVTTPRGVYIRALEAATGQPIENLGFQSADERYGLDRSADLGMRDDTLPESVEVASGPLTGIWLSRYEYVSSGRGDQTFSSSHYVVILPRGQRVQVRASRDSPGRVIMDLTANARSSRHVGGTHQPQRLLPGQRL